MTPLRSSTLNASSDLLKQNQTSNGVYPVSRPAVDVINFQPLSLTSLPRRLMG